MKNPLHLIKRCLKNSPGFTLVELMVAMAVGSLVMGGVFVVWTQLFDVTATNSNYMAAFYQVQNGGDWTSNDALMTQGVYAMASTELDGGITDSQVTIPVDSTAGFPPVGVIAIEDELIQYIGKTDTQFTGCIRGSSATTHDDSTSVTFFIALNWTAWSGDQYQVVYNLKETSRELMRSQYINGNPQTAAIVAEAINLAGTTSAWDYDEKELTVTITAQIGDEVVARTYKVNPRPLF